MMRPSSITQIALLACDLRTSEQLEKVTSRMGISCSIVTSETNVEADIIVVDVANFYHQKQTLPDSLLQPVIVGLVGHGTPTEIDRAVEIGATAVVQKPINQNGLFAAFTMARNLKFKQQSMLDELNDLRQRHGKRPQVIKATTAIMHRYQVDVDKALSMLRHLSMQNNCPLEQLCEDLIPELTEVDTLYR